MVLNKFSGAFLKNLAVITMIIDHIGAVFFTDVLILRIIGRLSFVLFAFLLAEGAFFTKNRYKYYLRLFAFALISFVPYSLVRFDKPFSFEDLNVFFVLSSSVLMIGLFDLVKDKKGALYFKIAITLFFIVLGTLCNFDYGCFGFLIVSIFYNLRQKNILIFLYFLLVILAILPLYRHFIVGEILIQAFVNALLEGLGIISLFFIFNYNGERGKQLPKPFYYWFFPVHLLILWTIKTYCL
ncbi:MAG: conjugal transfer protein TraX [Bacteroidales bacterium]|nr:conjugal transfer protein TraX [Bacteroidales bacterium]